MRVPSMQEKSGRISHWHLPSLPRPSIRNVPRCGKTEITENPAFTFRTFLLRLGLIGPEYKNVREHLLANLEGDRAWRYDRSTYECLNRNHRAEDAR